MKTVTFSHHKSPSQRIDTWQPTYREGTMPSWTKPTLDQLIIRFNASKSINHATPMWNKHIYLTPNSVDTNTHVSTLHSVIRKQLSEISQSTEWHFNAQPCRCSKTLRHSTLNHIRLTSSGYPGRDSGHQQLPYWTWHSWPESSHYINERGTRNILNHQKAIQTFEIEVTYWFRPMGNEFCAVCFQYPGWLQMIRI